MVLQFLAFPDVPTVRRNGRRWIVEKRHGPVMVRAVGFPLDPSAPPSPTPTGSDHDAPERSVRVHVRRTGNTREERNAPTSLFALQGHVERETPKRSGAIRPLGAVRLQLYQLPGLPGLLPTPGVGLRAHPTHWQSGNPGQISRL